jgi:hypothetical protein
MNIREKRKTDRFVYEISESAYVELKVRKEPEKKFYDLVVVN